MKSKLLYFAGVLSLIAGLASFNAMAEGYTVQGTITSVQPIYKTKTVTDPVKRCWTEDVPVYGSQGDKTGDALAGAIIGGIIGNNVTKNVENGGAVGALLGGIIGHNNSKKGNDVTGYRQVQKCSTDYNSRTEEYVAGYKIGYDVLGLSGTTTSNRNLRVGSPINVSVNITAY